MGPSRHCGGWARRHAHVPLRRHARMHPIRSSRGHYSTNTSARMREPPVRSTRVAHTPPADVWPLRVPLLGAPARVPQRQPTLVPARCLRHCGGTGAAASLGVTQSQPIRRWDRRGRSLMRGLSGRPPKSPPRSIEGWPSAGPCHCGSTAGHRGGLLTESRVSPPSHLQLHPTPRAGTSAPRLQPPSPKFAVIPPGRWEGRWPSAGPCARVNESRWFERRK